MADDFVRSWNEVEVEVYEVESEDDMETHDWYPLVLPPPVVLSQAQPTHRLMKDDLKFVKNPPEEIKIKCPICLCVMFEEPHLTSCCGQHFCKPCIKQVIKEGGACPYCKAGSYQTFLNKDRQRIIRGLKVYCSNGGCNWKGELKDLLQHINKGEREGKCQFEVVQCGHDDCKHEAKRMSLTIHEKKECAQRPYDCEYCKMKSKYDHIVNTHYTVCSQYPVRCPNGCEQIKLTRGNVKEHKLNTCPLEPVSCELKWAGCNVKPLRKGLKQHTTNSLVEHFSLLATACGKLQRENEELKKRCDVLERKAIMRPNPPVFSPRKLT